MNKKIILNIKDLNAGMESKKILTNLNLTIKSGEIHAIMGPNGSGKSTLANVLARNPKYQVTSGSIQFMEENLLDFSPEDCAHKGMFLSFQHPVAIPGVSNLQFIKVSINAIRKKQQMSELDSIDFLSLVKHKLRELEMPDSMLNRAINDGFSGGEQKRNEILQMLLLNPKLAILDEIDSGLDIDALKTIAKGINSLKDQDRTILIITHYNRLLEYIEPNFVHVLANGQLIHSGDKMLPLELENKGYSWLHDKVI